VAKVQRMNSILERNLKGRRELYFLIWWIKDTKFLGVAKKPAETTVFWLSIFDVWNERFFSVNILNTNCRWL